jgi:hypothetical protein
MNIVLRFFAVAGALSASALMSLFATTAVAQTTYWVQYQLSMSQTDVSIVDSGGGTLSEPAAPQPGPLSFLGLQLSGSCATVGCPTQPPGVTISIPNYGQVNSNIEFPGGCTQEGGAPGGVVGVGSDNCALFNSFELERVIGGACTATAVNTFTCDNDWAILNQSIGNYFPVGSKTDPSPLLGPTVTTVLTPPPPICCGNSTTFTYPSYAWVKISVSPTCSVGLQANYKQWMGGWETMPAYDNSYKTTPFATTSTKVSPNGNLILSTGANQPNCPISLSSGQNNLVGLKAAIAKAAIADGVCRNVGVVPDPTPPMPPSEPAQDSTGKWYISLYNNRCINQSCAPRSSNTLTLVDSTGTSICSAKTIQAVGCNVTALAMALAFVKVPDLEFLTGTVDPASLDNFMSNAQSFTSIFDSGGVFNTTGDVMMASTVGKIESHELLTSPNPQLLTFVEGIPDVKNPESTVDPTDVYNALDKNLCDPQHPHPVIVGVKPYIDPKTGLPASHHYVLVYSKLSTIDTRAPGTTPQSQYLIADPQSGGKKDPCPAPCTLDTNGYFNSSGKTDFIFRGVVKDLAAETSSSGAAPATASTADPDLSQLNFSVDANADILVTDSNGSKTGVNLAGNLVQAIPGSTYWRDAPEEDQETGVQEDTTINHAVDLSTPAQGSYTVAITGLNTGLYTLDIRPFSTDGTAQPSNTIQGIAGVGSNETFQVQYASASGSTSTVTKVATFQSTLNDISTSLQLGLITNAGIATALSAQINAASSAASRGNEAMAVADVNSFISLVNAQTNRMITGIAPAILLADGQSLLDQL